MYQSSNGKRLNADINGALNILKKSNVVSLEALTSISRGSSRQLKPSHVFFGGKLVGQDGKLLAKVEDFEIKANIEEGFVKVNLMKYNDLLLSNTELTTEELPVKNGIIQLTDQNIKYVAVVNRHEGKDTIGLGLVRGFGTKTGALASTVSHDSHNLTIVYDTPENALKAANELIQCGGGMCAVKDGEILHTLQLPLAGLISLKPAEKLAVDNKKMKEANRILGLTEMENPLLRIVTLALPVIPNAKMSDLGLVDVLNKKIVPLFAD